MNRFARALFIVLLAVTDRRHAAAASADAQSAVRTVDVATKVLAAAPLPRTGRYAIVLDGTRATTPMLEIRRSGDDRVLVRRPVCASPTGLAAHDELGLVGVICVRSADDDDVVDDLWIYDANDGALRASRSMPGDDSRTFVALPGSHEFLGVGGDLLAVDARNGRLRLLMPHVEALLGADRTGRFAALRADDDRIAIYDLRARRTVHMLDVGQNREPRAAAFAENGETIAVVLAGSAEVAVFARSSGEVRRIVPFSGAPTAVAATTTGFVVAGFDAKGRTCIAVLSSDGTRLDVESAPLVDRGAPNEALFVARDDGGGAIVDDGARTFVFDARGRRRFVATRELVDATQLRTFDPRTGVLYAFSEARLTTVPTRTRPRGDVRLEPIELAYKFSPFVRRAVAAHVRDARAGFRSPIALALLPNGATAVAEAGAPYVGISAGRTYRRMRLPDGAAATALAVDPDGTIRAALRLRDGAFGIGTIARDRITVRRVVPSSLDARRPLASVDRLVRAADGAAWAFDPRGAGLLRISPDGTTIRIPLPPTSDEKYGLAARSDGGVYAAFGSLFSVEADGRTKLLVPRIEAPATLAVGTDGLPRLVAADAVVRFDEDGGAVGTPIDARKVVRFHDAGGEGAASRTTCEPTRLVETREGGAWIACGDRMILATPDGGLRNFPLLDDVPRTSPIALPDGAVRFAEPTRSRIGTLSPNGALRYDGI